MSGKIPSGGPLDPPTPKPTAPSSSPWPALLPQGDDAGKPALELSHDFILIGSHPDCHIKLLFKTISPTHAMFLCSQGRVYIRDLASRTHVLVNDRQVLEADLQEGDRIQIGQFVFQFKEGPAAAQSSDAAPDPPAAMLEQDSPGQWLPISGRVTLIGRGPDCDLPLNGKGVSDYHAVIFALNGKRYICDLASRTGIFVNDRQETRAELRLGDNIRIGPTTLLHYEPASLHPHPPAAPDKAENRVGTAPAAPPEAPTTPGDDLPANQEMVQELDAELGQEELELAGDLPVASASAAAEIAPEDLDSADLEAQPPGLPPPDSSSPSQPPAPSEVAAPGQGEAPGANAPAEGGGFGSFTESASFIANDQGSFLGGVPLSLQELPAPPPTFGQVRVSFGDRTRDGHEALPEPQDLDADEPPQAPPPGPYDQVKVDDAAAAAPAQDPLPAPQDQSAQEMLERSRKLLPRHPVPPRPRFGLDKLRAGPPQQQMEDANPFNRASFTPPPRNTGDGFGAPFGVSSGPQRVMDVFGGGLSSDLSDDLFLSPSTTKMPTPPARKGGKSTASSPPAAAPAAPPFAHPQAAPQQEETVDLSPMPQTGAAGGANRPAPPEDAPAQTKLENRPGKNPPHSLIGAGAQPSTADPFSMPVQPIPTTAPAGSGPSPMAGLIGPPLPLPTLPPAAEPPPGLWPSPAGPRPRSVGILLLIMALLMAGSIAGVYWFIKIRATVSATMKFDVGPKVEQSRWLQEVDHQNKLLADARTNLAPQRLISHLALDPGFLIDPKIHLELISPKSSERSLLLSYRGTDAEGDKQRLDALKDAMQTLNRDQQQRVLSEHRSVDETTRHLQYAKADLASLQSKLAQAQQAAKSAPDPQALEALVQQERAADEKYRQAVEAVAWADAAVAQMQQPIPARPAPPATGPAPAGGAAPQDDQQLLALQKQLEDLSSQLAAAHCGAADEDADAHRAVAEKIEDFQKFLKDAQGRTAAGPLAAYIDAANSLQQVTASFINQLRDAQRKSNQQWTDLKNRLDQQLASRRKEMGDNDPQIKAWQDNLQMLQREYNAAQDTLLPDKARDIQSQMDQARRQIDDRKHQIAQDPLWVDFALRFQELIDKNAKELDTERMQASLNEAQERFAEVTPKVQRLPLEQRELVEALSKKLDAMNLARIQYVQAIKDRNAQRAKAVADLQTQAGKIAAQIEQRLRMLAPQSAPPVDQAQAQRRLGLLAARTAQRDQAQSDCDQAKAAWNRAIDALAAAQRSASDALGADRRCAELTDQIDQRQVEIIANQRTLASYQKAWESDICLAAEGIEVGPAQVEKDRRAIYAGANCGAIFILFSWLILREMSRRRAAARQYAAAQNQAL